MLYIIFFSILALVFSREKYIVDLDSKNFDTVLQSNGLWLKPDYKKAAKQLAGVVNIAQVNCDEDKVLPGKYGVKGFPTLKIFSPGGKVDDYQGQRSAKAIVKELMRRFKKMKDPVKVLSGEMEISAPVSGAKCVLFSEKEENPGLFKSIGIEVGSGMEFVFASVPEEGSAMLQNFGVEELPAIIVLKEDGTHEVYDGDLKKGDILKFLTPFVSDAPVTGDADEDEDEEEVVKPKSKPKPVKFEAKYLEDGSVFGRKCEKFCLIGTFRNEEEEAFYEEIAESFREQKMWRFLKYNKESEFDLLEIFDISEEEFDAQEGINLFFVRFAKKKYLKLLDVTDFDAAHTFLERIVGGNARYEKLQKEIVWMDDEL